ncbi:FAD-dependent monooxygenase [Physcia stellaris]|nr:FAD-dependent monooxygenase [Physcia stellaris]
MSRPTALIVGASIAGPTAAYWLSRAGFSITIIERFPALRPGGQNIDIRTCGVTVMRRMAGMEAAVRSKLCPLDGLSFVRSDGRPYGTIRATGNPDQQSLVSEYEIFRGDLAGILYDLTKDDENIRYVFGEQVASMQQSEDKDGPITVEFANGKLPTTKYDLVVAADGATSRTRAIGLGCGVRTHISSVNTWSAYFSVPGDLLQGSRIGQAYSAAPGRFYAIGPDPEGVSRICLMKIHPRNDADATLSFRQAMKAGDAELKRFIAEHYSGTGWRSDEIVKGMMESNDFYASEVVQVKPPSLSNGRFVMVGDAGYAPGPTGGGTTLALAGAYLLAGEISKHQGDIVAGLNGYEQRMRPIITEMQKIPPLVPGIMAPQTAWGVWLRNWIFAFITWSRVLDFVQRFFAGAFAESDGFPLPEYEWVS